MQFVVHETLVGFQFLHVHVFLVPSHKLVKMLITYYEGALIEHKG